MFLGAETEITTAASADSELHFNVRKQNPIRTGHIRCSRTFHYATH
jgi:hypothetical protein